MKQLITLCLVAMLALPTSAQIKISAATYATLNRLQDSVLLNHGQLKLYNLFKLQLQTLYENQHKPVPEIKHELLAKTYEPYKRFWNGYVGDDTAYLDFVIQPLLDDTSLINIQKAISFAEAKIDSCFEGNALQLQQYSGHTARGTWYLAFGSGITDMGGLGEGVMVLDMAHRMTTLNHVLFILPHELNHQVFDYTSQPDTNARGLYRCINEGFAVWVNQQLLGNRFTLAQYLMYKEEELEYCIKNEALIYTKLKPFLLTADREHGLALADRGQRIFKEGPGAIGYFIGYRICQSYVQKHGADSWKDIYTMPVRELLELSGYNP